MSRPVCKHLKPLGDWCALEPNTRCPLARGGASCLHPDDAVRSRLEATAQGGRVSPAPFSPAPLAGLVAQVSASLRPNGSETPVDLERRVTPLERHRLEARAWQDEERAALEAWQNTIPEEYLLAVERRREPPGSRLDLPVPPALDFTAPEPSSLEARVEALLAELLSEEHAWQLKSRAAAKLVRFILRRAIRDRLEGHPGVYYFGTYADVAREAGVSLRSVQAFLSSGQRADPRWRAMRRWLNWRTVYDGATQPGGRGHRVGTVFRVSLEPRSLEDASVVPGLEPWVFAAANRARLANPGNAILAVLDVCDVKRNLNAGIKTFPTDMGNATPLASVAREEDGAGTAVTDLETALSLNNRKTGEDQKLEISSALPTPRRIRDEKSVSYARAIVHRLGDTKTSLAFWIGVVRRALEPGSALSMDAVWGAVSSALEAKRLNRLRGPMAAYAVGALIRAGAVRAAPQRTLEGLETVVIGAEARA